ncbi:MAG: SIMPL domain-containing protein, partial [Planctomycetota bacterium]
DHRIGRDHTPSKHEAITRAVRQARAEAEVMASAAGGTLGPVIMLQSRGGSTRSLGGGALYAARSAPSSAPVESGLLTITGSVEITFAFEPN